MRVIPLYWFPGNSKVVGYLGRSGAYDVLGRFSVGVKSSILGSIDCTRSWGGDRSRASRSTLVSKDSRFSVKFVVRLLIRLL